MLPQSHRSPNCGNFGTSTSESGTKSHLDVAFVKRHKVYYKGEGGGFPQVQAVVNLMCANCSWFVLAPKNVSTSINHFMLVCASPCK
jgi:hypothetical protein